VMSAFSWVLSSLVMLLYTMHPPTQLLLVVCLAAGCSCFGRAQCAQSRWQALLCDQPESKVSHPAVCFLPGAAQGALCMHNIWYCWAHGLILHWSVPLHMPTGRSGV
jgi:hypothetical protein